MKIQVDIPIVVEVHGTLDTDTGEITFQGADLAVEDTFPGQREYALYTADADDEGNEFGDCGWLDRSEVNERWGDVVVLAAADNYLDGILTEGISATEDPQ